MAVQWPFRRAPPFRHAIPAPIIPVTPMAEPTNKEEDERQKVRDFFMEVAKTDPDELQRLLHLFAEQLGITTPKPLPKPKNRDGLRFPVEQKTLVAKSTK